MKKIIFCSAFVLFVNIVSACDNPQNLKVAHDRFGNVQLFWDPVTNTSFWEIKIWDKKTTYDTTFVQTSRELKFNVPVGSLPNGIYHWKIRAFCNNGTKSVFVKGADFTLPDFSFNSITAVTNGLIGLWHLNGNTNDSSGFGHNGTIVGTVTQTAGQCGTAYHFNGSSYINCGNVDLNSTGEFSVSAWVKSTDPYVTEVWRMVVSKLDGSQGGPLELFLSDGRSSTGTAGNYFAWNGGIGLYNVFSAFDLSKNAKDGAWHHLAVTFKSGSQIVYFDGLQVASGTSSTALPNTTSNFHIGGINFGAYHKPWIGDIDEVSAYNRVLSPAEIQTLAQGCNPTDSSCENATNLTTTNITSSSATLNWSASTNPSKWQVQYKPVITGSVWTNIKLKGTLRSINISALNSNQKHKWRIRAKCDSGWTDYSESAIFKTLSVTNGLIGLWHLNGNTIDSSGFGHNGTIVGTLTQTAGQCGTAYHFNGSSYIDCGNVDLNSTGEFSVSAWVKSTDPYVTEVWRMVVSKLDGSQGGPLELFLSDGRSSTGTAGNYFAWNGGIGLYNVFSAFDLSKNAKDGAWHHLAVTFKSGSQIVYFDGLQVASGTSSTALPNTTSNFHIGGINFGSYHKPWIGDIDEVSAYNRALSPTEIQTLAQGCNPISPQNAIAQRLSVSSIRPNPSAGNITIQCKSNSTNKIQLNVYNTVGKKVYAESVLSIKGDNLFNINLTSLATGIYYLELINENEKNRIKFVIAK